MAGKKISELISSSLPPLSGSTAVVHNGTTYQSTLNTLRQVLVDSGSHVFTGSQTVKGDLIVSGSIIAQEYIVSSSVTNIVTETVSGSSNFGNSLDDNHNFTGSVNVTGSLNVDGIVEFDRLIVGGGDLGLTGATNQWERVQISNSGSINTLNITANHEYYTQLNLKNTNSGSMASGDIVVTADNGNEGVHYVDLGINSSTYTGGVVGNANDSYLINVGKDMYVGTVGGAPSHLAKLKLFSMNTWENPQITIDNTEGKNLVLFNTGSVSSGYTYEFSGSAKIVGEVLSTDNLTVGTVDEQYKSITLKSSIDNFPSEVYNAISIDIDNNGPHSMGFAVSTYTGIDGTNPVGVIYGGGTGSTIDGTNQSIVLSDGKVLLVKNTESLGSLIINGVSENINFQSDFSNKDFNYNSGSIFYVTGLTDNGIWNVNNVPTTNNKSITMTFVVEQGSTPYSGSEYQINEETVTIKWVDGNVPTGSANKTEIIGLTAFRVNSSWNVLGALSTFS